MILRFSGLSGTNVMTPIRIMEKMLIKKDEQRVSLLLWRLDGYFCRHTVPNSFLPISLSTIGF